MRDIEDYAKKYQANDFELEYKVPYRRKHVLEIVEAFPHDSILEIGCGLESLFSSVRNFKAGTVVEPSSDFAEKARAIKGVSVLHACLEDCIEDLQNERFDFIVLSALLHEVEQPINFLRLVHSLCSKETVVHINVPNANSFHRLLGLKCAVCNDVHELTEANLRMQQHTVFDARALERVIRSAAEADGKEIDVISRGSWFVKPFTNGQMGKCLQSGAISPSILDGLDKMIEYMPNLGSEIYVNYQLIRN